MKIKLLVSELFFVNFLEEFKIKYLFVLYFYMYFEIFVKEI